MPLSKTLTFLLLMGYLCLVNVSCVNTSSKNEEPWKLSGTFNSDVAGYVHLQNYEIDDTDIVTFSENDSVLIKDGQFTFSQKNADSQFNLFVLRLPNHNSFFQIVPIKNNEELTLSIDLINNVTTFKGTSISNALNDYERFQKEKDILFNSYFKVIDDSSLKEEDKIKAIEPIERKINDVLDQTEVYVNNIETPFLSSFLAFRELLQSQLDKDVFTKRYTQLSDSAKTQPFGKTIHRIITYFDAFTLSYFGQELEYETLQKEFKALSLEDQNSVYGKKIVQLLKKLSALKKGATVPPLLAKTADGKPFDLKDVITNSEGIVLLDFWASWCGPCREENPNYVKLNKRFGKKLTLVGYSFDTDAERWKKAIEKDKLTWTNVSNLKPKGKDPVQKDFQIAGIPANLLIKEGVIIGRNLRGKALEEFIEKAL